MAEVKAIMPLEKKSWLKKPRGASILKSNSKMLEIITKTGKQKIKERNASIDEGLVNPAEYVDLFMMATIIIGKKKNYFTDEGLEEITEEDEQLDKKLVPPNILTIDKEKECKLNSELREEVYKLILRVSMSTSLLQKQATSSNKTGATAEVHSPDELNAIGQAMLHISGEEHKLWSTKLIENTNYHKILQLKIHEAENLPSSDSDGLSDPYFKFGMVPRTKTAINKMSLKDIPDPDTITKGNIERQTVNPKWEEYFEVGLLDQPRVLVLEVWDDDQENAAQRRPIHGWRGLKFKIKDFFSKDDDFLCKCLLNLADISPEKSTQWFNLIKTSRFRKPQIAGRVHATTEIVVRVEEQDLNLMKSNGVGIKLYMTYLTEAERMKFIKDAPDTESSSIYTYIGDKIVHILGLNAFTVSLSRIQSLTRYTCNLSFDRSEFISCLDKIISGWSYKDESKLSDENIKDMITSLEEFYIRELGHYEQVRILYPSSHPSSMQVLKLEIELLIKIFNFLKSIGRMNEEANFALELTAYLKKDITNWSEVLIVNSRPAILTTREETEEDKPSMLTALCNEMAKDLYIAYKYYSIAFDSIGLSYFDLEFTIFDSIISQEINKFLGSLEFKNYFSGFCVQSKSVDTKKQFSYSLSILKLYQSVQDLGCLKTHLTSEKTKNGKFELDDYQKWFKPCVLTWLDVARNLCIGTVKRAIEVDDKKIIQENKIKVTSSSIDVSICFEQCYQFYQKLNWPVEDDSKIVSKLILISCDIGKFYTRQMEKNLISDLDKSDKDFTSVTEGMCVLVNNCVAVITYLKEVPKQFKWQDLLDADADMYEPIVSDWRSSLDEALEYCNARKVEMIQNMIQKITKQFKILFNEFIKKPSDQKIDDAIDDLMTWMSLNLEISSTAFIWDDFITFLENIWNTIVQTISELQKSKSKQFDYCNRLNSALDILYQFLYVGGNGLNKEKIETENFQELIKIFQLYGDKTEDVISSYCYELVEINRNIEEKFGNMTFTVIYNEEKGRLEIGLIKANNLPKMDILGSCDPFIKIKSLPKEVFDKVKSKHVKNSRNPSFGFNFDISISEEKMSIDGGVIMFSLYDHDMVGEDDYGGSIYISFKDISRNKDEKIPIQRNFMFPVQSALYKTIYDRPDKDAAKFRKKVDKKILASQKEKKSKKSKEKNN